MVELFFQKWIGCSFIKKRRKLKLKVYCGCCCQKRAKIEFECSNIAKNKMIILEGQESRPRQLMCCKIKQSLETIEKISILTLGLFWQYKTMLQVSETNLHREEITFDRANIILGYTKVNAYTHRPALEQILAIVIFVSIVALHAVFITSNAGKVQSVILWTIIGVCYGLLVVVGYDYIFVTCNDPVDDLVLKVQKNYKQNEKVDCFYCKSKVHQKSHHCQTCHRCVQQFDHHCKYLNNCIGGKNYPQFIRLLLTTTFFCVSIIGSGVWVFVVGQKDATYGISNVSRWGALITGILAAIAMLAVDSLLAFHFYLIFWVKMTTFQYIKKGWEEEERIEEEKRKAQQP